MMIVIILCNCFYSIPRLKSMNDGIKSILIYHNFYNFRALFSALTGKLLIYFIVKYRLFEMNLIQHNDMALNGSVHGLPEHFIKSVRFQSTK